MAEKMVLMNRAESELDSEPMFELVEQHEEAPEPSARSIHLIDPSSEVLLTLFEFFSNAGFHVSASSNADDALSYIARSHPRGLIAPMDMPEMTGLELLERTKAVSPTTVVLLRSAYPEGQAAQLARRAGAADIVPRSLDRQQLLRAISHALDNE